MVAEDYFIETSVPIPKFQDVRFQKTVTFTSPPHSNISRISFKF